MDVIGAAISVLTLSYIVGGSYLKYPVTTRQPFILKILGFIILNFAFQAITVYFVESIDSDPTKWNIVLAGICSFIQIMAEFLYTWLFAFKYYQASSVIANGRH